ncbi:phosphatase PAP2 family protein, partial [Candidatus Parcubacteria bacterium]
LAFSLSHAFINSSLEIGWLFALLWFLLAVCISISRVIVGVHYFFDIIAGFIIGCLISYFFIGLNLI